MIDIPKPSSVARTLGVGKLFRKLLIRWSSQWSKQGADQLLATHRQESSAICDLKPAI